MDDNAQKCWLCGRGITSRAGTNPAAHSGIPIHRECLENSRSRAGTPLVEPSDVVYLSAALFRT